MGKVGLFIFLRLLVALWLVWAAIGVFFYGALLRYFGWDTIGIELRWTLFVALSLAGTAVITLVCLFVFHIFNRRG